VHGLIHLMGFAKAFGFAQLAQLTQPISRPVGVVWLSAGLLMIGSSVLVHGPRHYLFAVGVVALVCSQIVIAISWRDAWAGTLANLILAGAITYLRD
jgi:hypothetical protein